MMGQNAKTKRDYPVSMMTYYLIRFKVYLRGLKPFFRVFRAEIVVKGVRSDFKCI